MSLQHQPWLNCLSDSVWCSTVTTLCSPVLHIRLYHNSFSIFSKSVSSPILQIPSPSFTHQLRYRPKVLLFPMDAAAGTGGSIADSLEEFDTRYSESYSQILSSPDIKTQCSELSEDDPLETTVFITYQDFNTRLELSSPLMEETPTFSTHSPTHTTSGNSASPSGDKSSTAHFGGGKSSTASSHGGGKSGTDHHYQPGLRRNKSFSYATTSSRSRTSNQNYTSTSPVTVAKLKRQLSITMPSKPSQYVGNPFYKEQWHKLASCLAGLDPVGLSRSNSKISKNRKNSVRADDGLCMGRHSQPATSTTDTGSENDSDNQ